MEAHQSVYFPKISFSVLSIKKTLWQNIFFVLMGETPTEKLNFLVTSRQWIEDIHYTYRTHFFAFNSPHMYICSYRSTKLEKNFNFESTGNSCTYHYEKKNWFNTRRSIHFAYYYYRYTRFSRWIVKISVCLPLAK